jgi:hypothetical protein
MAASDQRRFNETGLAKTSSSCSVGNWKPTIVRRWQTYTGESARHLPTNRTFKQIESERELADVAR